MDPCLADPDVYTQIPRKGRKSKNFEEIRPYLSSSGTTDFLAVSGELLLAQMLILNWPWGAGADVPSCPTAVALFSSSTLTASSFADRTGA